MGTINRSALRDFRLARGWSLADLAARVGTNKGYLSKIETGKTVGASQDLIQRLAESLGVDVTSITNRCQHCSAAVAA